MSNHPYQSLGQYKSKLKVDIIISEELFKGYRSQKKYKFIIGFCDPVPNISVQVSLQTSKSMLLGYLSRNVGSWRVIDGKIGLNVGKEFEQMFRGLRTKVQRRFSAGQIKSDKLINLLLDSPY